MAAVNDTKPIGRYLLEYFLLFKIDDVSNIVVCMKTVLTIFKPYAVGGELVNDVYVQFFVSIR